MATRLAIRKRLWPIYTIFKHTHLLALRRAVEIWSVNRTTGAMLVSQQLWETPDHCTVFSIPLWGFTSFSNEQERDAPTFFERNISFVHATYLFGTIKLLLKTVVEPFELRGNELKSMITATINTQHKWNLSKIHESMLSLVFQDMTYWSRKTKRILRSGRHSCISHRRINRYQACMKRNCFYVRIESAKKLEKWKSSSSLKPYLSFRRPIQCTSTVLLPPPHLQIKEKEWLIAEQDVSIKLAQCPLSLRLFHLYPFYSHQIMSSCHTLFPDILSEITLHGGYVFLNICHPFFHSLSLLLFNPICLQQSLLLAKRKKMQQRRLHAANLA